MKASDISIILNNAFEDNQVIGIEGPPGIGKSSVAKQAVNSYLWDGDGKPADLLLRQPVVDEPTKYLGLPARVGDHAEFLPYGDLCIMRDAKRPLVVMLDDLGQATQAVQASLMPMLLDRQVNGLKISDFVRFVYTTNGREDGAGVTGLLSPLRDRTAGLYRQEFDLNDWRKWAFQNGVHPSIIAFLSFNENLASTFNKKVAKSMEKFATPRTYADFLSWHVKTSERAKSHTDPRLIHTSLDAIKGCIGDDAGIPFHAFYQIYTKVGLIIDRIMQSGSKVTGLPIEITDPTHKDHSSLAFSVVCALACRTTISTLQNCYDFVENHIVKHANVTVPNMNGNADLRAYFFKAVAERNEDFTKNDTYNQYMIQHPEDFQ